VKISQPHEEKEGFLGEFRLNKAEEVRGEEN